MPALINSSHSVKLIAASVYRTYTSLFSTFVQYPVDVRKDLLLIYNSSSTNSTFVANYYLTNRPMVAGAKLLPVACRTNEWESQTDFSNQIVGPLTAWLTTTNPTLRPTYVVTFIDMPQRVSTDPSVYGASLAYSIYTNFAGWQPYVHSINLSNVTDCLGYINKLTNYPGQLVISASAAGYNNTNYYFDGVGLSPIYGADFHVLAAMQGVMSNGVPAAAVNYITNPAPHINNGTNVAGYWSYGNDGGLPPDISTYISWAGNSGWYIMGTVDSFNGQRAPEYNSNQSYFLQWFCPNAFGGTSYSRTPIGAVSHVFEPEIFNVENTAMYFGLWAAGKTFGTCAWASRQTPLMQATGDPLVRR